MHLVNETYVCRDYIELFSVQLVTCTEGRVFPIYFAEHMVFLLPHISNHLNNNCRESLQPEIIARNYFLIFFSLR